MKKFKTNERGNVLFLILIAVALFAALSYAVTQSSRSGGDSGRETTILNSAQLSQYPNSIRTAVLRQVIDGVAVDAVRFNAPASFAELDGNRLGVFHPEGGGAVFQQAPGDFMQDGNPADWTFNLDHEIEEIGVSGTGATGNDLIAFLVNVTLSVCQRINVEAGVMPNISDAPPISNDLSATYVLNMIDDGSADYSITANVDLDTAGGELHGRPFGCFQNDDSTGPYVFYQVLNER